MDSDSDDQLLESDRFSDLAIEMSFSNTSQNHPQPRAKYRNYHSIDWLRELSKDKARHQRINRAAGSRSSPAKDKINKIVDAASGWIVVLLIGVASGLCAGVVDVTTKWLADFKRGICTGYFWLNQEQCCWTSYSTENCTEWKRWGEVFGASSQTSLFTADYFMYILFAVTMGAICGLVVKYFSPYATGSGIPEVKTILSGFVIHGYLGICTLLGKMFALPLAVGAGLSLGKEGPLVHVASCCGNAISRLFPKYKYNQAKRREMLSAAAAAGVSVAFGAPIGGVLFSLEEVSYYFPLKTLYRSFLSAMTAAFVLRSINPFGNEHLVMFYSHYDEPWYWFELIGFIVVGILGGLYGAFFNKMNIIYCKFRRSSKLSDWPYLEVVVTCVATAILCFPNYYTQMAQSELISMLFKTCNYERWDEDICHYTLNSNDSKHISADDMIIGGLSPEIKRSITGLILAMLLYMALTIVTFGIKVPSGLFIPSMTVGAIFGRLVGLGIQQFVLNFNHWSIFSSYCGEGQVCVNPGLYAMVGAASTLSGVTRMTVSLVVIMYELTGGLFYIVPLMVATMTAKWIGDAFGHEGIYDLHIKLNNYPFLDSKTDYNYSNLACDVMRPRPEDHSERKLQVITAEGQTLAQIEEMIKNAPYHGFPVVLSRSCMRLIGFVVAQDLQLAIDELRMQSQGTELDLFRITSQSMAHFTDTVPIQKPGEPSIARLSHILDIAPVNVSDVTPMALVLEIFRKLGIRHCMVLRHGKLQGIITRKDILYHIARLNSYSGQTD